MPTSVRLDAETEAILARLVRRTGRTKSEILREAVTRLVQEEAATPVTPYEKMADLVGVVRGGPTDLASRASEAFREKIASRKRSR